MPTTAPLRRPLHWLQGRGLLLILLAAYVMMGLLITEQGRIIEAQRTLIRQLFDDSLQLNAMKVKQSRDQQAEQRR